MSANTTHGHGINDAGHRHSIGVKLGQGNAFTDNSVCFAGAVSTSNTSFTRSDNPDIWKAGSWMEQIGTGLTVNNSGSIDHSHAFTGNTSLGAGDNETRPTNSSVNYIIKI